MTILYKDHCKERKEFDTINAEAFPGSAKKIPLLGNLQLVFMANISGSRGNVNNRISIFSS